MVAIVIVVGIPVLVVAIVVVLLAVRGAGLNSRGAWADILRRVVLTFVRVYLNARLIGADVRRRVLLANLF